MGVSMKFKCEHHSDIRTVDGRAFAYPTKDRCHIMSVPKEEYKR